MGLNNKQKGNIDLTIIILLFSILAMMFFMAFLLPIISEIKGMENNKFTLLVAIAGFFLTILGWFLNSHWNRKAEKEQSRLDRKLQQKQLAIQILHENRFQEKWIESRRMVFTALRSKKPPNWVKLHEEYMSNIKDLESDDNEMYQAFIEVLNYFEFTSIAVKNKAIDSDIFKWSYKGHFRRVYKECKKIFKATSITHPTAFCNYLDICKLWFPDENGLAEPDDE